MSYIERSGGPEHHGNHNGAGEYDQVEKNLVENRKKIRFSVNISFLGLILVQSCILILIFISNTPLEVIITADIYPLVPYIVIFGEM